MNQDIDTRPRSGTQWVIEADGHRAVVVEVGGGLRSYRVHGQDVVDAYGEDEIAPAGAGTVLAPWPNRIRDGQYSFGGQSYQLALSEPRTNTAIHGLVNGSRWRVEEHTGASVTVSYELPPSAGYPWALLLRGVWTVSADGLTVEHSATNLDRSPCPFGFSVHPYLRLPGVAVDDVLLRVPARSRVLTDGRMLPIGAAKLAGTDYDFTEPRRVGEQVLDTTFTDVQHDADGRSAVTMSGPGGSPSLAVWADGSFRWWQVFSSDTLHGERYRRSLAIEPMTCPPDAFRSGRDVLALQPGETWTGRWGVRPVL